jgi:sporulation protein YlmC with PRC-barrel domain
MTILKGLVVPVALALALAAPMAVQASTPEMRLSQAAPQAEPTNKASDTGGMSTPATVESRPLGSTSASGVLQQQDDDQSIASEIVGLPIFNNRNEEIGEITDLILDEQQQVVGAVVAVGGFLGLGTKSVGVPWGAIRIERRDGESLAFLALGDEELAAAPAFLTRAERDARRDAEQRMQQQLEMQKLRQPKSPVGAQ